MMIWHATLLLVDPVGTAGLVVPVQQAAPQTSAPPVSTPPDQAKTPDATTDAPPGDAGDIVVTARHHNAPGDPLEGVNLKMFAVTQSLDKSLAGPIALAYKRSIPDPMRSGLRNFLGNLDAPIVFLNDLLQFKPGRAGKTLGRFTINSTAGVAGFFDLAKRDPINLPRRHNGLANTFGYYGIKTGPYFYVPLVGPTTLRDMAGGLLDTFVLPLSIGTPFNKLYFTIPTTLLSAVDDRAEFDDQIQAFRRTSNPYVSYRTYYLAKRKAEIEALHTAKYRARKGITTPAVPADQPKDPAAPPKSAS